ncbi:MAG: hypothetical protein QOE80_2067, partial [Actinomycetota bacterium]|nr:hypothetical protein [Actinomycetota bacterium]
MAAHLVDCGAADRHHPDALSEPSGAEDEPKGTEGSAPDEEVDVDRALDRGLHGQGLGAHLLADIFGRVVEASMKVAVLLVVVDAIDAEAVAFYEHFGFVAVPEHTHRLFQK